MADKRLYTPVGTAVYPRLKNPDTKYNDLGQYKADLSLPMNDPEVKALMDELLADYKAHVGKAHPKSPGRENRNAFYYIEEDEEGEPTGNIVLKLRVTNKIRKRDGVLWDRKPAQFDAALKPIDVNPWGGTKMSVSFDVYEWNNDGSKGFSLQPIGVQIIDLVTGDGPSAENLGFAKRDGYVAPKDVDHDDEDDSGPNQSDDADDGEVVDGADY